MSVTYSFRIPASDLFPTVSDLPTSAVGDYWRQEAWPLDHVGGVAWDFDHKLLGMGAASIKEYLPWQKSKLSGA